MIPDEHYVTPNGFSDDNLGKNKGNVAMDGIG